MTDVPPTASVGGYIQQLAQDGKVGLGKDGKTPTPLPDREQINGAPVENISHEFVMKKPNAQN